ncbi:MAG: DNA gyrase inhibitor YacG, partial [Candidatus Brocadiales bacterium]
MWRLSPPPLCGLCASFWSFGTYRVTIMPKIECRNCGKGLSYESTDELPFFPFCSERCKLIDLGKWVEGEHRIEEPLTPDGAD